MSFIWGHTHTYTHTYIQHKEVSNGGRGDLADHSKPCTGREEEGGKDGGGGGGGLEKAGEGNSDPIPITNSKYSPRREPPN